MQNQKDSLTFLLNWRAMPYHAPILLGQALGYYEDLGLHVAVFEPHNPSDVPGLVCSGSINMGLKAMIHCFAVHGRGLSIRSVGTLLDEPYTGLLYLESSGIREFMDLRGKRLGYVGQFGKVMIDDLAQRAGFKPDEYETVRVGMNVVDSLRRGSIDAGIGLGCHHRIELEETVGPTGCLRIDELAGLGCCCFCSIQVITNEAFSEQHPERVRAFLKGTLAATHCMLDRPVEAFDVLAQARPEMNTPLVRKIFFHTLPFFSRTLLNVARDWQKVHGYSKHLRILPQDTALDAVFTNDFVPQHTPSSIAALPTVTGE